MLSVDPSLRQLRAFEAAASTASINRAAEKLHLSQSAVSQSIAQLENALGVSLLQRRSNGSFLTQEGKIFCVRIERALKRIEAALATAAETGGTGKSKNDAIPGNVTSAQISALIAIDEYGSYSAAAEAMGISRPAINRHARDIEMILRRPLFSKTSQGKATTRAGRELARELQLALKEVQYGQDELAAIKGESHGTIVIGILPLGASLLVSQGLGQLSRRFPKMKAHIVESPFEALLNWLQTGRIDVIIGTLRPDQLGGDIDEIPLFTDPYCLVVRKQHPLCSARNIDESDLRNYEWILPRQGTPRRIAVEALFDTLTPRPMTIVETSSMGLTRDLLLNGDRVTLLSRDEIMFEERLDLLRVLDFPLPTSSRVIGSITRSDWLPTELQENFLSILRDLAKDTLRSSGRDGG